MARSLFYTGVNGTPINTQQYSRLVDGTPYFNDDWRKATVIMPNGNAYENVDVRIDCWKAPCTTATATATNWLQMRR
jgi:hypothetical protein